MSKTTKDGYKKLLADNKTEQLIETMLTQLGLYLTYDKKEAIQRIYDAMIILSGQWRGIKQEQSLNIIDDRAARLRKDQITHSILLHVNGLPAYYFAYLNGEKIAPAPKNDLRQQVGEFHKDSRFEYDAFLSFSSKDLEEARRVCAELRGYGLHVFLSDEVLKANTGQSFNQKIEHALSNSQHFILLSSVNSMASEWVQIEYETFFNECYIKNKKQRRFIILKGEQFSLPHIPKIYRRLQFAATPKEILATFVKDQKFVEKQKKQAEKERLAQAAAREKQEAEKIRLAQIEKNKQTAVQQKAEQARLEQLALQEVKAKKAREEKRRKAEARGVWWQENKTKVVGGLLGFVLLVLGMIFIPPLFGGAEDNGKMSGQTSVEKEKPPPPKKSSISPIIQALERNMKSIPSGTFTMGCTSEQQDCDDDEKHLRDVSISGFKMNRYEVTQEEWRAVMGADPPELKFKGCDKCPVERVSWNDIQEFLKKLNKITGKNYRLPSEAEWEYAARGNEKNLYAGSNTIGNVAWHNGNSSSKTHPVGGKNANGFGLYDMSGNVWEWCQDTKHKSYEGGPTDGRAWTSGGSAYRVLRGGSWNSHALHCRVSYRNRSYPDYRYYSDGFRLAHS